MKRMDWSVAILWAAIAFSSAAICPQASAELITNGNFESVTGSGSAATFTSWTYATSTSAVNQTGSVIDGSHSAEIVKGISAGGICQSFGTLASNTTYTVSFDFSVFACATTGDRTLNMLLVGNSGDGINLRIGTTNSGTTQSLQIYSQANSTWQTISALTTIKTTSGSSWGSVTPAINTLTLTLYTNANVSATSWTYDITLNGVTTTGLNYYQPGIGSWCGSHSIGFQSNNATAESDYLVDDVSVSTVPEPGALALLGVASVLAFAYARRRK